VTGVNESNEYENDAYEEDESPIKRDEVAAQSLTEMNSQMRDQQIDKLQQINLKLRNKIKDLNYLVEKALEKQQKQVGKGASLSNN